ncbi:hypothetical protein AWC38_SpisGene2203 [Stylophora pistillata]|uniref:RAMA domain-containing protein n=1 Tax=Stylophora pistillata TaxID=50429 RepID=A0A2B4SUY8_STYPI|nr:hypothetical protein AWC38_SpisGene2203 [Stylophora pistillata]
MSDSDETVCEEVDDPATESPFRLSPSIIAAKPRNYMLNKSALGDVPTTGDSPSSPEFLPPEAKVQKLAINEKTGTAKTRGGEELKSSWASSTTKDKQDGEKLLSIKEKEDKIEELLVSLESDLARGIPLKESSVFPRVKQLMTAVKTQLAHFTHYQQQQRQQIVNFNVEPKTNQDGLSSQGTYDARCKLLELAAQQKELLKLLQGQKKLFEKIQALKQKAKTLPEHVIPAVEVHCKSRGVKNMQQESKEKSTLSTASMTTLASNINLSSDTVCTKTMNCATSICSQHLTFSTISHCTTLEDQTQPCLVMPSYNPTNVRHVSTATHTSMTSPILQSRIQDTVLTGGQVCYVEGKQVNVLPRGLNTSVAKSFAFAQAAQAHATTPSLSSNSVTSASATDTKVVTEYVSNAQSGISCTWLSGIPEESSLMSSVNASVLNCSASLQPISVTTSLSKSTQLVPAVRYPITSSTLQSSLMLCSENSSQVLKQATLAGQRTSTPSQVSSMNSMTVSQPQPGAWTKSPVNTSSQIPSGGPSKLHATKTTSTPLKGPTVQSGRSSSLQRKGSFGSDLPDIKTLISHNVIEAGMNVLSIQHEGRNFEASLRSNGLIESAGGETFRTPMAWMRAVTGSWNTIKQSHAYKMVHFKGKPLALFTIPSKEKDTCENKDKQASITRDLLCNCGQKESMKSGLMTSWDDVAKLLTDCQVMHINKDEMIPSDSFLPIDFWEATHEVDVPQSVLDGLDF